MCAYLCTCALACICTCACSYACTCKFSVRVRVRVRVRVLLRVHIYKRQKKVVPFSPPISAKPALLSSKSFLKIVSRLEMR